MVASLTASPARDGTKAFTTLAASTARSAVVKGSATSGARRARLKTPQHRRAPLHAGPLVIDREGRTVRVEDKSVHLSPKEFNLLELLVERPGRVLSKSFLLERVWNMPGTRDDRTIAVHVARLRKKIGDHRRRRGLIATVPGVGYVLQCGDGAPTRRGRQRAPAVQEPAIASDGG